MAPRLVSAEEGAATTALRGRPPLRLGLVVALLLLFLIRRPPQLWCPSKPSLVLFALVSPLRSQRTASAVCGGPPKTTAAARAPSVPPLLPLMAVLGTNNNSRTAAQSLLLRTLRRGLRCGRHFRSPSTLSIVLRRPLRRRPVPRTATGRRPAAEAAAPIAKAKVSVSLATQQTIPQFVLRAKTQCQW